MKALTLGFWACFFFVSLAFAGTEQSGVGKGSEQSSSYQQWFADSERTVGISGGYAFPVTEFRTERKLFASHFKTGYLNADHAWGGSLETKYFFRRYFGLGVETDILAPNALVVNQAGSTGFARIRSHRERLAVESVLASFTLRYPIGSSRFAPYAYAGGGAIFGGGRQSILHRIGGLNVEREFTQQTGSRTESLAQFGGGVEFRLTRHIGLTNDFSWNIVNGPKNNFGLIRSGINFAF